MPGSWIKADKLTGAQQRNIATIIAVGHRLGASERDITIALMTAAQESEFVNIGYGDNAGPDSRGLFQQRAPWGTLSQRMDPVQATVMFFTGGHDGQRGLFDFKNRDQLSLTRAAQAVQVSAFPDAYAKHADLARGLLGSPLGQAAQRRTKPLPQAEPVKALPRFQGTMDSPGLGLISQAHPASPLFELVPPDPTEVTSTPTPRVDVPSPTDHPITALGINAVAVPGVSSVSPPGHQQAQPVEETQPVPTPQPTSAYQYGPVPIALPEFKGLFADAGVTHFFTGAVKGGDGVSAVNGVRSGLIDSAMSYLGQPYEWGGLDCSGLVQRVYAQHGVDLPRLSADQIYAGQRVDYADLKPGDLIGWQHGERNGSGVEHIAIYAGNNQIIEAPRTGLNVRRRTLSDSEIRTAEGAHFAQFD